MWADRDVRVMDCCYRDGRVTFFVRSLLQVGIPKYLGR
jgi:hypothetical protein